MTNEESWPDQKNLGLPPNPDKTGAHLLIVDGERRWGWWSAQFQLWGIGSDWQPGTFLLAERVAYVGPAKAPDGKPV